MRPLMTDLIEVYEAPDVITPLGETVRNLSSAVKVAEGLGTLQLYFSAEYDVDRDTKQRLGRIISDDPRLYNITPKQWVLVNGVTWELDGYPQKWTLRGLHHIEVNIKKTEG
jgi:hypothetical protein